MLAQCSPSVVSTLSDLPTDAVVRVVVKGAGGNEDAGSAAQINPQDFGSSTEYRQALIRQHNDRTRGVKQSVVDKAREVGLMASPAASLNAVTVEGHPHQVLEFLKAVDIETAVLEKLIGAT